MVRRAVEREVGARSGRLQPGTSARPKFPTCDGGRVLVSARKMKSVLLGDEGLKATPPLAAEPRAGVLENRPERSLRKD